MKIKLICQTYFPIHCTHIQHLLAHSPSEMLVPAKSELLEPFKGTSSLKTNLTNDQQTGVAIDGGNLM